MALRNDINAETKADLVAFNSAADGQAYILLGETAKGDTPIRFYYYDVASTATVDGENVLSTTGMGNVGRYIKETIEQVNSDWLASSGNALILNKPTIPTALRQERYSGTTNASGVYSITYGTTFASEPNVQFNIKGGTNKMTILLTSSTTSGCSFLVEARADVLGLLPSYSNVNGAAVKVLVTEA